MALPTNVDVIVVHGYWLDELTGKGVKGEHGRSATVTFEPVPLTSQTENPNLRDIASHAHLKTRTRIATIDPDTGYFAVQLVASNDPDLEAYGGRRVTMLGEDPFVIEVPSNALTVTVDAAMAAKTGLAQGSTVRAVALVDASVVTNPPPTPPVNYLTSAQTLDTVATGIEVHDTDPQAHADLRALLAAMPEQARDAIGAALVAGSNVTITPNDGTDTITISVSVPSGGAAGTPSLRSLGTGSTQAAAGNDSRLSDPRAWTLYSPDSSPSSGQVPTWNGTTYVPATVTSSGSISDASSSSKGVVQLAGDLSGTAASPRVVNVPRSFTQSTTKTANYTAADNEIVLADTTAGTFTITGPTSGTSFGLRWRAGTAAPTIAAPTGYTISGSATVTAGLAPSTSSGELVLWQAFGTDYQPIGGLKPQSALNAANDLRYDAAGAGMSAAATKVDKSSLLLNVLDFGAYGDGTAHNDTVAIQSAINTAATAGGGVVYFPPGHTYNVSQLVMKSFVELRGGGWSSKILQRTASTGHLIVLDDVNVQGTSISDIMLHGNKANQSASNDIINYDNTGGSWSLADPNHRFSNILLYLAKNNGMTLSANSRESKLLNIFCTGADGNGFNLACTDSVAVNCTTGASGKSGFVISGPNSRFSNCKAYGSGQLQVTGDMEGFRLTGRRVALSGCEAQDNGNHGFVITSLTTAMISLANCVADSNGQLAAGNGFYLNASSHIIIKGSLSFDRQSGTSRKQRYGIAFNGAVSTVDINMLTDNNVTGSVSSGATGPATVMVNAATIANIA